MARIRTIKPDFFRHVGLFNAERETGLPLRVAFAGLWTACDREGRFVWEPIALKLDCLPYDDLDFATVLDALATRGFLVRYACGTRELGYIPSWRRHQHLNNKERPSDLPNPLESTAYARVNDAQSTRDERVVEGEGEREGKGKGTEEEKERAREVRAPSPSPAPSAPTLTQPDPAKFSETGQAIRTHAGSPPAPDDVPAQVWADWLALRRAKRAPVTPTVVAEARREADRAGMLLAEFLGVWCARGSQGLQAAWLRPSERSPPNGHATPAWLAERQAAIRAYAGPFAAGATPQPETIDAPARPVD